MNKNQRITLIGTAVVVLLMLLFPPFYSENSRLQTQVNKGYLFIAQPEFVDEQPKPGIVSVLFDPPKRDQPKLVRNNVRVDVPLLLAQWLGVLIVGGILFRLAKYKEEM